MTEELIDEKRFTPWASPGFHSWNGMSPEVEFCGFAGVMQKMMQAAVIIETGVGAGRVTQFLDLDACTYLGFEADEEYRQPPALPDRSGPSNEEMAVADFVILDSGAHGDLTERFTEITQWVEHGKPGSVCLIHDAGNGHLPVHTHSRIRAAIEETGIHGIFLGNPRGGWLAQHP